jgi:hypothetical protein
MTLVILVSRHDMTRPVLLTPEPAWETYSSFSQVLKMLMGFTWL